MTTARPERRPTVSVIIPNYNYAKTLGACLEAVLGQSHPPHEVIVVDDASTDASREIARRHPCTLLESAVNHGVSAARNRGVAASSGEILFFLDSDVAPAPDAVEAAVAALTADPGLGCVHGVLAPEPLFDDGPVERYHALHAHYWRWRGAGEVTTAVFALGAMPRAAFEAAGPFDENLRDSEDIEYSNRLTATHRVLLTPAVTGRHDDVDRLWPMLGEQFRRSQLLLPVAAVERDRRGGLRANRPFGALAAALTVATAPLGLLSPVLWFLPVLWAALFATADPGLAGCARRTYGTRFLPRFLALHFLLQLALVSGALAGALRWLVDRRFGPSAPTGRETGGHRPTDAVRR